MIIYAWCLARLADAPVCINIIRTDPRVCISNLLEIIKIIDSPYLVIYVFLGVGRKGAIRTCALLHWCREVQAGGANSMTWKHIVEGIIGAPVYGHTLELTRLSIRVADHYPTIYLDSLGVP